MRIILLIAAITINSFFTMAQINYNINPVGAVFAREGGQTPEGTFRFSAGGYEVFTIVTADKDFQPASLYYGENGSDKTKVDALAPDGKVPTSMNCFVVHTTDGYVMFDTGLPSSKGGKTLQRMSTLNIPPDKIKRIYLTHGHFDHIGGLLDEERKATFKNAIVYISSAELASIKTSMAQAAAQITDAYSGRLVTFCPWGNSSGQSASYFCKRSYPRPYRLSAW